MYSDTIKQYIRALTKSFIVLLILSFFLSLLFKGLSFFLYQYVDVNSFFYDLFSFIAVIVVVSISFFGSTYVLGKEISIKISFIFPTIFLGLIIIVIGTQYLTSGNCESFLDKWLFVIFVILVSYFFSFLGASRGSKKKIERERP